MPDRPRAAFFDVDGTLVRTNIVHAFAFYAMNQGSILGTAWQHRQDGALGAALPGADRVNRKTFNEFFYRYYRGQSEDRLETLAEELFEDVLKPAIFPGSRGSSTERGAPAAGSCSSPARSTSPCAGWPSTSAPTTSSPTACGS